ncbi:Putative aminoglycoside nucleotidyltransferase [Frankia alni ACN14a]|uniref:Aminoglycoside nucleotidyltransferase n=1 Tax=Frankia alni (strain DSM 45986 / CECT 9034 / ACN14a) TaxID=326424 RepID=Q0RKQ6_FRAAA|nr:MULTISPECIES: hypothetical protein [Frankia]CAJ61899.1 Putative aminoglycoside nucleotidyltransferase [Frankia alni ACN14a]
MAAGWALDLFRGTQTREHGDVEIAVPAANFPEIRGRFPGYAFDAVSSGRIWANATPDVLAATRQTWLRDTCRPPANPLEVPSSRLSNSAQAEA